MNDLKFPVYFESESLERDTISCSEYSKMHFEIVKKVRERCLKSLYDFDQNFDRNYVTESSNDITKDFSINGAIVLKEKEYDNHPLTPFEKNLLNGEIFFKQYRGNLYSRSYLFYRYEFDKKGNEYDYLNDLVGKIKLVFNKVSQYQEEISSKATLRYFQWKILFTLLDNYILLLSQLFNAISYINTVRDKNYSVELEYIKSYYFDLVVQINSCLNGKKIDKISCFEIDFDDLLGKIKPDNIEKNTDKGILRGAFEGNNHLFNDMWGNRLSEEISRTHLDDDIDIAIIGLHYGGIQLPHILKHKLGKRDYKNVETVSCHFSSKNSYSSYSKLFDQDVEFLKDKTIYLVDDTISSGKSLFTIFSYLKEKISKDVNVSAVNIERLEGTSCKRGGVNPLYLKNISSISRVSPIAKFRSLKEREERRNAGEFHLSRWLANRMLYKNLKN